MSLPISRYQSPIKLNTLDSFCIIQHISLFGNNYKAIYDPTTMDFNVQNKIMLQIGNKKYILQQYHFHVPSEHVIDNRFYSSEIHYVFAEEPAIKNDKIKHICCSDYNNNLLVISRVIDDCPNNLVNLEDYPVKLPCDFFEYDGGLTTGDFTTPVRWIVGIKPIMLSINQIKPIAKETRILQPINGRLITRGCNNIQIFS